MPFPIDYVTALASVRPASQNAPLPDAMEHAGGFEAFRSKLREGAGVFVLDDSPSVCESLKRVLDSPFGGRVSVQTDPVKALDEVAAKAVSGESSVLLLDMDMPGLSGRRFVNALYDRGLTLPFVIVSGGQGSAETRSFLSQVGSARSRHELEAAVDERLEATGGAAFTYIRKEDVAADPDLLLAAVDSMLLARRKGVARIDGLLAAEEAGPAPAAIDDAEKGKAYAGLADIVFSMTVEHSQLLRELGLFMKDAKPNKGQEKFLDESVDRVRSVYGYMGRFDYATVSSFQDTRSFGNFRHDILGSKGLSNSIDAMHCVRMCFDGGEWEKPARDLLERYQNNLARQYVRFRKLEDRLFPGGELRRRVEETVKYMGRSLGVDMDIGGSAFVSDDGQRLLSIALKQALVNAQQANPGAKVAAEVGLIKVADIPSERVRGTFSGLPEVGYVSVEDMGPGIGEAQLESFRRGEDVTSTKTGQKGMGLALMRGCMEDIDGATEIENTGRGTKVTLYFRALKEK